MLAKMWTKVGVTELEINEPREGDQETDGLSTKPTPAYSPQSKLLRPERGDRGSF